MEEETSSHDLNVSIKDNYEDEDLSPDSEQELLFEKQADDNDAARDVHPTKPVLDANGQIKKLTLKKAITPLSGIGFVVGNLIGSGIFITPSHILSYTGSFGLSLMCWLIGGVVALAGALCYFELGLLVRKTGGEYAILLEAYSFRKKNRWVEMLGSLVSFLYTWTSVFVLRGASGSIITLTCARYVIRPFFIGCEIPGTSVKLLALAIIGMCVPLTKLNTVKVLITAPKK